MNPSPRRRSASLFVVQALACLFACSQAWAAPQTRPTTLPDEPPGNFALTIYSTADPATFDPQQAARQQQRGAQGDPSAYLPGYAVVREIRPVEMGAGQNRIAFADVASGIDPTTVAFKSITSPDTAVLEQNYEFDLASADKMLAKCLGKDVLINRRVGGGDNRQTETIMARLLSFDESNFVLEDTRNKQLPYSIIPRGYDIAEIKLFGNQTGLITKPTLVWKVDAPKAGLQDVQVTYQTDGLTWRADYALLLNETDSAANVSAWVSILNESGASYPNAKLKLVAGDVQRLARQQEGPIATGGLGGGEAAKPAFAEKAFFEYHLYTLDRPSSLANHSTKQLELFPPRDKVALEKAYVYYGAPSEFRHLFLPEPQMDRRWGTQMNKQVDVYLQIQNSQKQGLGLPLPAGRVRVYKTDPDDGNAEFIGEDVIAHTPKDETLSVRLGSAFDIVGERKQTDFTVDDDKHIVTESFKITLRNHKKDAVKVVVKENLYRWSQWEITERSDKYDKTDSRTIEFAVQVPAEGEKTVTYTVKYTW